MEDWKARLILTLVGSWQGIRTKVVIPVLNRTGSIMTTWMLARGVPNDLAEQIATGVIAVGLVLFDLIVDQMRLENASQKARIATLEKVHGAYPVPPVQ
jgi:hypothetical protein